MMELKKCIGLRMRELTRREINEKLEIWGQVLEMLGFCSSGSKTDYMEYKFSNKRTIFNSEAKIVAHTIRQVSCFQ